jgi:hypothetical protein
MEKNKMKKVSIGFEPFVRKSNVPNLSAITFVH